MLETPNPQISNGGECHEPQIILIVDDNLDVLHIMAEMVENLGYVAKTVSNGGEALEALTKFGDVALVITDVVMPGELNGIALAERISVDFRVPTVLATGSPQHRFMRKANDSAAPLLKPFSIDELGQRITAALAVQ